MPGVMRDDFLAELPETCVWRHHGSAETKQVLMSAADNSGISHTQTHTATSRSSTLHLLSELTNILYPLALVILLLLLIG